MNKIKVTSGVVHDIPKDLKKELLTKKKVLTEWENITPLARNEWICWIENAKKSETRNQRIKRVSNDLLKGKHRPCCWPGCPHRDKKSK